MDDTAASPPSSDDIPKPGGRQWLLLFILTFAYTMSFVDRQALNLLIGPVKAQFSLNDTEISLLQGLAFTGAYVVFSPLFGRLADLGSRRAILASGVGVWSIGTSLCGMTRTYTQLFFARCGVGGAEACLTPAAWSILADSFPRRMIPRIFSIFLMGPYLGGGLALIFGGLLLEGAKRWHLNTLPLIGAVQPWQLVFLLAGLPGLLIVLLLAFVPEPPRRGSESGDGERAMTMREIWQVLVARRGFYLNFYIGMPCLVITLYAYPAWMPTVLIRQFGVPASVVGLHYGALVLVSGSIGVLAGPALAAMIERRGRPEALLILPFYMAILLAAVSALLAFVSTYGQALAVATIASFAYSVPQALASSCLQLVTPNRMRGVISSIYVFVLSVVGLGAAPTIVALLTDHVFHDEKKVGLSLMTTCIGAGLIGAIFLRRALGHYRTLCTEQRN